MRFWWPLAVLLAAAVPALLPLLEDGLPATGDGYLHLQRLMLLDRLIQQGVLFSRWIPDLAYGYGQPVFNYYGPLVYAPSVAIRLLGATYADSQKATMGLILLGSGLAMFALARALFPTPAALAAALVYLYLPYLVYDVYVRGALAEAAMFVWLPLACLGVVRIRTRGGLAWSALAALAVAALVLTHNSTALFALPSIAALALCLWTQPDLASAPSRRSYALRVGVAILAGLGLAAWFWAPALLERRLVHSEAAIDRALFDAFLLRSWPPFQTAPAFDYREPRVVAMGGDWLWPQLGIVQVAISLAGTVAAVRARGIVRRVLAWAIGLFVVGWGLQFAAAAPLYQVIPLAAYIQYPWRLLTLVGLGSSLLAGALVSVPPRRPVSSWALAAVVVSISAWAALARFAPLYEYPTDALLTPETVLRAEQADFGIGTTHFGEFLPAVTGRESRDRLRRALLGDEPRDDRRLPSTLAVEVLDWTPTAVRLRVDAAAPDRLLLHQFYFPGWQARLDGEWLPIQPSGRLGVIGVEIPQGAHVLQVELGWTSPRLVGLAISALVGLALAALVIPSLARRRAAPTAAGRRAGRFRAARQWPPLARVRRARRRALRPPRLAGHPTALVRAARHPPTPGRRRHGVLRLDHAGDLGQSSPLLAA